MNLTISNITLEFFWGSYAYFAGRRREVFVKFSTGLPFWFFSREREDANLELWGFGMKLIINPR